MTVAIDTIVVLDNLQYTHENTADIYAVHADGVAGEAVKTIPIALPHDVWGARVIINNNYGATGSTVCASVRLTALTAENPICKAPSVEAMPWTQVALGACVASAEMVLTSALSALVHIAIALIGTTAHLGTEIIVQIRGKEVVDKWTDWTRITALSSVTAFKADVKSTALAAQKVIPVDNPTAGNLNHVCKNIFILDTVDVTKSEICFQVAWGADS